MVMNTKRAMTTRWSLCGSTVEAPWTKMRSVKQGNTYPVSESTDELRPNNNESQLWIGNSLQPATKTATQGIQMGTITDSCVVRGAHIEGPPSNWEVNEKVLSDQPWKQCKMSHRSHQPKMVRPLWVQRNGGIAYLRSKVPTPITTSWYSNI